MGFLKGARLGKDSLRVGAIPNGLDDGEAGHSPQPCPSVFLCLYVVAGRSAPFRRPVVCMMAGHAWCGRQRRGRKRRNPRQEQEEEEDHRGRIVFGVARRGESCRLREDSQINVEVLLCSRPDAFPLGWQVGRWGSW